MGVLASLQQSLTLTWPVLALGLWGFWRLDRRMVALEQRHVTRIVD